MTGIYVSQTSWCRWASRSCHAPLCFLKWMTNEWIEDFAAPADEFTYDICILYIHIFIGIIFATGPVFETNLIASTWWSTGNKQRGAHNWFAKPRTIVTWLVRQSIPMPLAEPKLHIRYMNRVVWLRSELRVLEWIYVSHCNCNAYGTGSHDKHNHGNLISVAVWHHVHHVTLAAPHTYGSSCAAMQMLYLDEQSLVPCFVLPAASCYADS